MNEFRDLLAEFKPISLGEIDSIKNSIQLLKRHDTKFVLTQDKLEALIKKLIPHYHSLEISDNRIFKYENLYFDTDDYKFYRQHHNRKLNRYKFRYRMYADSRTHFWEVKFKNNKRKTSKFRFVRNDPVTEMTDDIKELTRKILPDNFEPSLDLIGPRIWITFQRVMFANLELEERVTFDTNLTYRNLADQTKDLRGIVIMEVKQARQSLRSPIIQFAKEMKIYPKTFSKYCTGIAMLEKPSKIGRFKRRIMNLEKMCGG